MYLLIIIFYPLKSKFDFNLYFYQDTKIML